MAGYSFTTLFVKLATRSGTVSSFMVLAVATTIVAIIAIAWMRGELKALLFELDRPALLWASPGAVALTIAVSSLFHALSLGPMGVVVAIYGMFILGGAVLGVLILHEP
jgi:transporter family protein